MEAHHASLGRRTLEEIRQKRAAERSHKASSASDLESSNPYGMRRSESGNQVGERDFHLLLFRVKELENKNAELEKENEKSLSKLEEKEVENDSLIKHLNDLEQNSLPSLRKALKDASIEKDAAIVAKEDALSQLRTVKKRLKETEEDQYRAEEDVASLRAELNSIQQQGFGNTLGNIPSLDNSAERIMVMEKEIMDLKSELQHESLLRQQAHQKASEQQLQNSSLMAAKQDLEERLAVLAKKASEEASELAAGNVFSMQDREKFEKQLHDLAVMVERLESSRQKLLMEIDSQSSDIERLFEENSNLSTLYQDSIKVAAQWENQVKDCLKQNEELRRLLDKLRSDQLDASRSNSSNNLLHAESENSIDSKSENQFLKVQLAKEQSRAEALAAEAMKLSAELKRSIQANNNLTHMYRPVLRNIETNLMRIKQETFVTVRL